MTNEKINYSVKKSKRAKRMRLAVHCDGRVIVTVPTGMGDSLVQKFINEKMGWISKKIKFFEQYDLRLVRPYSKTDYLKHKDVAKTLVEKRIEYFNKNCEFSFNRISVKNQKTRWGSCSGKKNLNFNYKIVFLSQKLQDYIIVHELCHLKEMNHSRKFWIQVESILPDYKAMRKDLKNHGL
ncbi:M48 family metallopeptidase [Patescibacteria group bacterium]